MATDRFTIPPFAPQTRVEETWTLPDDILLFSLYPHMHLRGKSFSYEAVYPDGRTEMLLNVPRYDFMWQHRYILRHPKRLPAGTLVRAVAIYDNSADNAVNPDPSATVRYGPFTTDEMFNGYLDFVILSSPGRPRAAWAVVTLGLVWLFERRRRANRTGPAA